MMRLSGFLAACGLAMICLAQTARAADAPATDPNAAVVSIHAQANMARPWRASQTIGMAVDNSNGDHLGKIEDLVFDPNSGKIRYAVLSFGGFLGLGDKYFAIPFNHLKTEVTKSSTTGSDSYRLVLDVSKDQLKNAPGFDSKNWPDFGDPSYGTSVDRFYGEPSSAPGSRTP